MTSYSYMLAYGSVRRYIESDASISSGCIVRVLKPADDRSTSDLRVGPEDIVPMVVQDYANEYHEQPDGVLKKVVVLYLAPPQPKKPPA